MYEPHKNVVVRINTEGKMLVSAPYHPTLPELARNLGGKWNNTQRCWMFEAEDEERVRGVLFDVYGVRGEGNETPDYVHVRLTISKCFSPSLFALGREIARRPGRDSQPCLGDGVIVESGTWPRRGGSRQYPALMSAVLGTEPVVLLVRNVPRHLAVAEQGREGLHVELVEHEGPRQPVVEYLRCEVVEVDGHMVVKPLLQGLEESVQIILRDEDLGYYEALLTRFEGVLAPSEVITLALRNAAQQYAIPEVTNE